MAPISRLDHVVIAVHNLDEAAATYRKLGFALTPRGLHEGKGTGNHCLMFGKTYIELLGVVDATGAEGRLAQRVKSRGEGAIAIAYGADDADKTCAALRAAGIDAEDPNDLARPLDLDGKREMVRFRNVMMPNLKLPETMQFVCTHLTPELTRARHEWQLHPNGAVGVAKIILALGNPQSAELELAKLFVKLDNAKIEIQKPDHLEREGIKGLTLRVNEIDAVAAMLDMGRIPHSTAKHCITVPATAAHGLTMEFTED